MTQEEALDERFGIPGAVGFEAGRAGSSARSSPLPRPWGTSTSEKRGSATTVVWNPWNERAKAMADLEPEAWRSMLCVETANAADNAVRLAPGERQRMTAVLRVEPA